MTKKLYKVEITRTLCVLAEDKHTATQVAVRYEGDEHYNEPDSIYAAEIKGVDEIPADWDDCIPYGIPRGEPELSIEKYINPVV